MATQGGATRSFQRNRQVHRGSGLNGLSLRASLERLEAASEHMDAKTAC